MANSLTPIPRSTELDRRRAKWMEVVLELLADGMTLTEASHHIARGDTKKASKLRRRVRQWVISDDYFRGRLADVARAQALTEGVAAVPAVGRRAQRGRVDAFKALNEMSGLHNPRVQHEHSGEVKITMTMPRPAVVQTVDQGEVIVDAEVVDD